MKTLDTWLSYISSIHTKKIDLSLERIKEVARRLGLLPFPIFSIMVAGTNGKGSTSSFMAHCLTNAGFKVGSTLSPHLFRFNERIKINMQEVSDEQIMKAFAAIDTARAEITLSYFEFNTLASLYIFKEQAIDIAVLEVGLGGRFDAINIVDANVAVITNIALDHQDFLGPDRESIAEAKAGIIKDNSQVVFGEEQIPKAILAEVTLKQAKLYCFENDFNVDKALVTEPPRIISSNLAIAVKTLQLIKPQFPIAYETIQNTAKNFSMPGRWQLLFNPLEEIYDVAHNPHSIEALKSFITTRANKNNIAVFSMLNNKDMYESMHLIKNAIKEWHFAPIQDSRAAATSTFIDTCKQLNIKQYQIHPNLIAAYQAAKAKMSKDDRLVIFGSFHTVAEVQESL